MVEQINQISQMWWGWMWPMFWQVSVLVGLVWVVDLIIRRRVWPQVRYALWLLVLLKLVLPPSLSVPTSVTSELEPLAREAVRHQLLAGEAATAVRTEQRGPTMTLLSDKPATEMIADTEVPITVGSPSAVDKVQSDSATLCWQAYVMVGWLLGVLILAGWLMERFRRLRRVHLGNGDTLESPQWFGELLADTAKTLKLRRLPRVILSRSVVSPAVFGAFRPVLLIPAENIKRLSRKEIKHVLLHELAHIKRGDLWAHCIYMMLQIIYWFNPLLWLVRRQLQHLRELCCDATVARILREETDDYRETILETGRQLLAKPSELGIGLLGLFEDSNRLLTRLKWLEKKTWKHRALRIAVIFAVVALMSACVLPMAKAGKNREDAAEAHKQKELQYIATLPRGISGVSVELVGVCEYPSKRCWRPDGSAIDEQIFATNGDVTPKEGDYGFMVKLDGPRDLNFRWRKIEGAGSWSGSCKVSDGQGNILDGFEAVISDMKEGQLSTTLRIGIAAGPWETIASHDGKSMNYGSRTGILWSQAFESRDGTHIVASNEWCKDRAERIVVLDSEGVSHATHHGSVASGEVNQLTATFRNLKLSQIREFRFQTRSYDWVRFKNVSLRPGVKTEVEVAVAAVSPMMPSQPPPPTVREKSLSDVKTKKEEILARLKNLEEQRARVQRDLNVAERALDEVRRASGYTDLEERSYPHRVTSRLIRLERERDNCLLEMAQLKAKIKNLEERTESPEGKANLKNAQDNLAVLVSKFEGLEEMLREATAQKRDLDLARIQYKQRTAIRDERKRMLDDIKAQIEKLKIMHDDPDTPDVEVRV